MNSCKLILVTGKTVWCVAGNEEPGRTSVPSGTTARALHVRVAHALDTNPTRQRGDRPGTLAGASG
jgi:hypothetical protein